MSILDRLPTVDKCCFCINLKFATIIIAILGIFSFGIGAVGPLTQPCPTDVQGGFAKIIKFFAYVVVAVQLILLVTSIILIIGVIMGKPSTATWFMYSAGFAAIVLLVSGILLCINGFIYTECPFPVVEIVFAILTFLMWVHFIAVVKSYQPDM